MPRKQHTYHYIYKTTCLVNERYYIGMHSTSNLEDGYIGSGKRLRKSINKYGKENHVKEILEFLPNRSSLKLREKELVNEDLLKDSMCMNLMIGGEGGLAKNNDNWKAALLKLHELKKDPEWNKKMFLQRSKGQHKSYDNGRIQMPPNWKNKKHKEETKKKIGEANSVSQRGSGNSQYGTCWITNEKENKKIHRGDLIPDGWKLGRKSK